MKHKFKQVLSLALVFCMVMSLTCINVYATSGAETETTAADTVAEASEEVSTESTEAEEATEETVAEEKVTEETVIEEAEEASNEDEISVASEDDISVASTTTGTKPDDGTTTGQPFSSGTGGSTYFRIPSIVSLSDDTIVAAADARWDTTYDGGGLDTIVSRSTDGGDTWSYTFANYLGDNGNTYNGSSSTAFIDPCMIVTDNNTIYMLVDLYPYGVALNGSGNTTPTTATGFTDDGFLKLQKSGDSGYNYYLKDGQIYSSDGTVYEGYTVDGYFNITYMLDGVTTTSNLFFEDSPFTVVRTGYLYLTTSTDGGATWSEPTLLNNIKTSSEMACLVAPGNGLILDDGTLIFPVYSYNGSSSSQRTGFIYSTDNGKTWARSDSTISWSSESTPVLLNDGTIRFFYRNGNNNICYVDVTGSAAEGFTWGSSVNTGVSNCSDCQISALHYSTTIDGSEAILVSCPTNSSRYLGKIHVFTLDSSNNMTEAYTYAVNTSFDRYQYSSMTELSDGSIALLYESGSAAITYTTLDIATIASGATIGSSEAETTVTDEATGITATAEGLTSISVIKGDTTTNDNTVSISYTITLNNGEYTGAATVRIPVDSAFADCDVFTGDVDGTSFTVTKDGSYLICEVPHFSTITITGTDYATYEVTTYVGRTVTITDDSGNYESSYTGDGLNTDVATVSVTGTTTEASSTTTYSGTKVTSATSGSAYYVGDGTNYLVLSGSTLSTTTDITQATAFTWTSSSGSYYLKSGSYYLRYSSSAWSTTTSTSGGSSATRLSYSNGTLTSSSGPSGNTSTGYSLYTMTENTETVEGVDATTISFTGVSVGTTTVTVGNTQYIITVEEAPVYEDTIYLDIGESETISVTLSDGESVTWSTEDSTTAYGYADITNEGTAVIVGRAEGTTYVTATVTDSDGNVTGTYTWEVVVSGSTATGNSYSVYVYIDLIKNTTVYYSLNGGALVEVTEGVVFNYETVVSSGIALCFFAAPDEGYALTYMASTNSASEYHCVSNGNSDGTGSDFYTGVNLSSTSGRPSDVLSDEQIKAMLTEAISLGCDGGLWFTRKSDNSSSISSTLSFVSQKLPTVEKVITKVNDEAYTDGMTINIGDTITYTVTVTRYATNATYGTITYSNESLTDELTNNDGITAPDMGTSTTLDAIYTYTTTLTLTMDNFASVVVDGVITNTVDLSYDYVSQYSKGTLSSSASAAAVISVSLPEYVIDFGLPVTIDVSEIAGSATLSSGTAYYGTVTVNGTSFTYKPSTVLTGVEYVSLTFSNGQTYAVRIYPATTVYYEEGFATYGTGWSVTSGGGWSATTNKGVDTQETHVANDTSEDASYNNYNYDGAYTGDTTGSEGTAASTTTAADSLSFTFTGTGVDIFANRTSSTGVVMIKIADSDGKTEKMLTVDTVDAGTYVVDTSATAYNSPIASVSDLDYGTHTVTIYVVENETFNFDGFRVYGTISDEDEATQAVYTNDLEDNPVYYELRNNVLAGLILDTSSSTYAEDIATGVAQVYATSETDEGAIVVYDTSSDVIPSGSDAADLLDNGPKNELYLYNGSSVVFKITTNREVQIGLRSVTGTSVTYTINGTEYTTSSSVDMFYDLQAKSNGDATETTYTITVTSGGILSITDIKVCDSTGESIFGSLTADEVVAALTGETSETETTADATLTVNLVDYTGSVLASTELTDNGTEGESATFAASDILAAVNEALPDGYALVDEDSVTDQTVTYSESGSVNVQIGKVATLTVTYQKYSGLFKKTTVGIVTLTKVQTSSTSKATFSASEIKAAVPSGYKVLATTSASVSYGSTATKTVTVY